MSDERADEGSESANGGGSGATRDDAPAFEAARYPDGSITYPAHPVGPGGEAPVDTVDLSEYTAEVITWTTSTATPPGVREPNHVAIVEFDVDGEPVRAIGQATTGDIEIGEEVEPVYCEELRDPDAGIREPASQEWDGFRFRPVE
ncbi:nucleic acid-binding protein [Halobaculum roseum]|uniref:Nucleic acid-binding protein n=1 Tax=Halobaculum roseum TaxID=2175149 RepID=A0ABD5ML19_9EURY|nr:nucleic acid-binding protein [Halobaculum roseum]